MVSVAVRHGRYVADWLRAGRPFVLNVVPEGQAATLKHFGRGFSPEEDAFAGLEIDRSSGGLPVLRGTVGHLECRPRGSVESNSSYPRMRIRLKI